MNAAEICPRCESDKFVPYGTDMTPELATAGLARPAFSRTDNETLICATCGTDESMRDYGEMPLPPQELWPVSTQWMWGLYRTDEDGAPTTLVQPGEALAPGLYWAAGRGEVTE